MNERDLENEKIYEKRPLLKAIKLKCLDCCGGCWDEVKKCASENTCYLHPYRLGKNPFAVKRELTEEQKQEARERFAKYREANKDEA